MRVIGKANMARSAPPTREHSRCRARSAAGSRSCPQCHTLETHSVSNVTLGTVRRSCRGRHLCGARSREVAPAAHVAKATFGTGENTAAPAPKRDVLKATPHLSYPSIEPSLALTTPRAEPRKLPETGTFAAQGVLCTEPRLTYCSLSLRTREPDPCTDRRGVDAQRQGGV
jgi:hypothetical protein